MAISTDKLVTLAQLRTQAERIKAEFAKYTLTSELGSLAFKSEISEDELSEALKQLINGKMDEADSMTAEAIIAAIDDAIAKSEHISFEEAATVPDAADAKSNVLYLVKNEQTGFYDIYALVGDKVVQLDDTTVDLSNYVTIDDLNDVVAGQASVYKATKDNLTGSDTDVINSYFEAQGGAAKKGDVFVIDTIVNGTTYEQSAYSYDGTRWVAMTGNVDADKVIMRGNITMAGDYTQVGNKTKSKTGTAEFITDGKSVAAILTDIFSKKLQPSITGQPSVASFSLNGAGNVEAGTVVSVANYSAATLNAGSYTYGPATGVTASNWKVQRITNLATTEVASVDAASLPAGSDNNGGNGFIIGDDGGDNTVSSLKYKVVATHGAGVQAYDNMGGVSEPAVAIAAGTKEKTTSAYAPFRNYFYGATEAKPTLDSAYIRTLTKSGKAYAAGSFKINVAAGTQRIAIACISGKTGVTKVINESAMNAEVTTTFAKQTVSVEGANGYSAKEYNVWVYEPAKPYENDATLVVTLG